MTKQKLKPVHPGEILMEEFLKPMEISQYRLAKDISVPVKCVDLTLMTNDSFQV
jgi:addiction module HigA family antidote